jgi:rhodanese-related sulfurtransferase
VDIRPVEQRQRDGELPGALVVDRNVLEWRLDPTCPYRLPVADDPARRVVLVCNEGYSSSLAAHTLQLLGLTRATDLVGGFQAWLEVQRDRAQDRAQDCGQDRAQDCGQDRPQDCGQDWVDARPA